MSDKKDLTKPQLAFLRRLSSKEQDTVWPGTDTRVANGLQRAGLISIVGDVSVLTDAGRERLAEIGFALADAALARLGEKACTCHPDDDPPSPCPRKYAMNECRESAATKCQCGGSIIMFTSDLDICDKCGTQYEGT